MKALVIGRTNVGKSSLFNRIAKKRKSLVFNESGITRDILKEPTEWWGHTFEIMDSGGLPEREQKDELNLKIQEHIESAMKVADVFIVVTDGRSGIHSEDTRTMEAVRKTGKPFIVFVNKIDNPKNTSLHTSEFFNLSTEILSGSVEQNFGVDEVIEWIISQKKKNPKYQKTMGINPDITSLFVIGKANGGKSLLCNQILNTERMIVSAKAGTTLDTVTEFFSKDEKEYSISDNPGSRRGDREEREKLSFSKSRTELNKSDIALLVVDGTIGAGRQDARLVKLCLEKRKPIILVINKMDLVRTLDEGERERKKEELKRTFHFYPDLPIVYISAKTAYHKEKLFDAIADIKSRMNLKIPTSKLNSFFTKIIRKAPSPVYGTSNVKFYYITQTHKTPPEFIAFANYPKGVTASYRRFVINQIKENWNLQGIPIGFHVLPKN